jgi:hypothetical protein
MIYEIIPGARGTVISITSIHPNARLLLNGEEITATTTIMRHGTFSLEYEINGERRAIGNVTFVNPNYAIALYLSIGASCLVLAAVFLLIYRQRLTKTNARGGND